ncbi:hypothetical protein LEM8419_00901 [Neolewinella maritima]|uniref:Uncharacterized protein n=1 Tax=Neolewinella maritima TaxID=1383882 RepID=A0ABM9AZH1_9BACT|nr:hypothetical protein [Neolewinella maritima]CAH0999601.1 hypothetical protein LEM8419_00901 [Neolewinella maritima]
MSLAFGALLTILLLLPGIGFRYAYIRSNSIRRSLDFSLLSEAVIMVVVALVLHTLGGLVTQALGSPPDARILYLLGTGGALAAEDYQVLTDSVVPFLGYTLFLSATGVGLGYALQQVVLRRGYDQRYKGLRVLNDWDRYFTGYVLPAERRGKVNFIWVDILVDGSGGNAVLYSGVLENYSLNREQVIDQVFISSAIRRHNLDLSGVLPADEGTTRQPPNYDMPGEYLVIPFSQVRNLNITYSYVQEGTPPETVAAPAEVSTAPV